MKLRNVSLAVAIVVLVAAGAVFYFTSRSEDTVLPTAAQATAVDPATTAATETATKVAASTAPDPVKPAATGSDDIMTPGPLGDQALGSADAPMTIIEYASMTCTHCQRFHTAVYPELKKKYIDTGKVRFIFREFPLDPLATAAFMLARCAPSISYFPIVDLLFDHQRDWAFVDNPEPALFNLVKQAGFTQESFKACLTNQSILDGVNAVKERGADTFGVDATPTFFFNGVKKSGELTIAEIDKLVAP